LPKLLILCLTSGVADQQLTIRSFRRIDGHANLSALASILGQESKSTTQPSKEQVIDRDLARVKEGASCQTVTKVKSDGGEFALRVLDAHLIRMLHVFYFISVYFQQAAVR
jgi:hypothetical protein